MAELLEPIIDFNMTELEGKAYKIGLIWLLLTRKIFPNYKHGAGYPKKGDPRKCTLFRYCYKLIRETNGLIPDNEYTLYVKAQLDVLKGIDIGGNHPRIEPTCLVGDKAWIRWKIWKKKFDVISKKGKTKEEVNLNTIPYATVERELKNTKKFFITYFNGVPKEIEFQMIAKDVERWVNLDKISGIYASLSPWTKKYCIINNDLSLFQNSITPEVVKLFKNEFGHEYV